MSSEEKQLKDAKKLEKQMLFIKKLNKLKAGMTREELKAKTGIKVETIKSWYRGSGFNYPTDENISILCEKFGVRDDYFDDEDQHFSLSYDDVSKLTGLSNEAICVLHSIQRSSIRETENRILNAPESYGRSYTTIDLINYVLEKCYDERSDHTVFDDIYRAIFTEEYIPSKGEMFGFMNDGSFKQTLVNERDLFQVYNLNQVTKWILDRHQEENKR